MCRTSPVFPQIFLHRTGNIHELDVLLVHPEMSLEQRVIFQQSSVGTFHFGTTSLGMPIRKVFDRDAPFVGQLLQEGFAYRMLLITQNFLKVRGIVLLTNRNGMEPYVYHCLKSFDHLALSYRQHLNGFALMLSYPGAIDFLNPMGNGVFVWRILCAKELI